MKLESTVGVRRMTRRGWRHGSLKYCVFTAGAAGLAALGLPGCVQAPPAAQEHRGVLVDPEASPNDIVGWSERKPVAYTDINPKPGDACYNPGDPSPHVCIGGAGQAPRLLRGVGHKNPKHRFTLLAGDLAAFGTGTIGDWKARLHRSEPWVKVEQGAALMAGMFYNLDDAREWSSWPWLRGRRITTGGPVAGMGPLYIELAIEVSDTAERYYMLNRPDAQFKVAFTDDQGGVTEAIISEPSYVEATLESGRWVFKGTPVPLAQASPAAKDFLSRLNAARVSMDTK